VSSNSSADILQAAVQHGQNRDQGQNNLVLFLIKTSPGTCCQSSKCSPATSGLYILMNDSGLGMGRKQQLKSVDCVCTTLTGCC
jgi:hypothetical protein